MDDNLHFTMGDVHIRQVVKYENYKRFGTKTKILYQGKEVGGAGEAQKKEQKEEKK